MRARALGPTNSLSLDRCLTALPLRQLRQLGFSVPHGSLRNALRSPAQPCCGARDADSCLEGDDQRLTKGGTRNASWPPPTRWCSREAMHDLPKDGSWMGQIRKLGALGACHTAEEGTGSPERRSTRRASFQMTRQSVVPDERS